MAVRFEKLEELTEDQKNLIISAVQEHVKKNDNTRPLIKDLVKILDPRADGRSYLGKAIKEFLEGKGIRHDTTKYVPKGEYALDAEEQDFIVQRVTQGEISPLKITKELFENDSLSPLDAESLAVIAFMNDFKAKLPTFDETAMSAYIPPASLKGLIIRANRALNNRKYVEENLHSKERKQLEALKLHLHSLRFRYIWQGFIERDHRELFESSVIRVLHDKDDITEAELNMFLDICADQTELVKISLQKALLEKRQKIIYANPEEKILMGLTEAYNSIVGELDKCRTRIEKNTKALTGTRAERLKNRNDKVENFASLVEAMREEDNRKVFVENIRKTRELLKEEVGRVEDLDAMKARILGIGPLEFLEG